MQNWKDKWPDRVTKTGQLKRSLPSEEKTEVWVHRFKQKHGDKYDYSRVTYVNNLTPVVITCPSHGSFTQVVNSHLNNKGCPKCSELALGDVRRKSTEAFILESEEVYGELYDYSETIYYGSRSKLKVICKKHGPFEQYAGHHLAGTGCPKCSGKIHDVLYCFRVKGTDIYKIGISTTSYTRRLVCLSKALLDSQGMELSFVAYVVCSNPRDLETRIHGLDLDNPFRLANFEGSTEYRSIPDIKPILEEYFDASI